MSPVPIRRYLPPVVTALLGVAAVYQLATIIRTLARDPSIVLSPTTPVPIGQRTSPTSDLAGLTAAHLFGETSDEATPVVDVAANAPATTLPVSLLGILFGVTGADSQAIMASAGGHERTYRLGESIENADGTTLHAVGVDHVLLRRGERLEAVYLTKLRGAMGGSSAKSGDPPALPEAADSTAHAAGPRALSLVQVLGLTPSAQEGGLVGFRVTAGADEIGAKALGLQSGDIVTDVRGSIEADEQNQVVGYGQSDMLNVTVVSDGVPRTVVIAANQLNRLRAKLQ